MRFRQGRLYKDGRLVIDAEERTVADRRRLGFVGIVSVALALDDKGVLHGEPEVELIGIPHAAADGRTFSDIALNAAIETVDNLPRARRRDPDAAADAVQPRGARRDRGAMGQEANMRRPRVGGMIGGGFREVADFRPKSCVRKMRR